MRNDIKANHQIHLKSNMSNHIYPIISIIGYLIYPKNLRINADILYYLAVLHNGCLVIYSAWTFVSLLLFLHKTGLVFESNYYFKYEEFDRLMFYFYVSKYYEFNDTFLLYLKGREPILLQKYHHIGAVISWHLIYVYNIDCIWIPTLANSFIHTIMYSYYLGCLLKIDGVRAIRQMLTTLQLLQLFGTMYFCNRYYAPPVETEFNYMIIWIVNGYNLILISLFVKFYYRNYFVLKMR